MTTYKLYKLQFTAPLHIGNHHSDDSYSLRTIQSDTLYAALTSCLAKTGHEIPPDGDCGFTLSSMFPYYQASADCAPVYFLPMPLQGRLPELKDEELSKAKTVKRLQWVDSTLYNDILSGEDLFDAAHATLDHIQGTYLTHTTLPTNAEGTRDFVHSEVIQRVVLNSRTGEEDAVPYYVDRITFADKSGLYFLALGDTDMLDRALNILAVEGIGTDRNLGFGFFQFTTDSLTLQEPTDATHCMALSMLIPENFQQLQQLLLSDRVAYDFARRGGWITTQPYSTLRKNAIYAFMPGSVFCKVADANCLGKIVDLKPNIGDLTPDHPIWRNGKSIMLPIKLKA